LNGDGEGKQIEVRRTFLKKNYHYIYFYLEMICIYD